MIIRNLSDRETREAIDVAAVLSLIILSSLADLAGATLLIGIVLGGVLMIFDHRYLPLFDQWLVASILFIVYRVAVITRRPKEKPAMMMVMVPVYPDLDSDPEAEAGAGAADGSRRLLLPPATIDQPRLTLLGHPQ
ncbi:MAG: hypothetical protein WCO00_05245 [Rhodospirillaceae bacterium]